MSWQNVSNPVEFKTSIKSTSPTSNCHFSIVECPDPTYEGAGFTRLVHLITSELNMFRLETVTKQNEEKFSKSSVLQCMKINLLYLYI